MQKERTVAGYLFMSEEDTKLAGQEQKKIEYLEKHMDYASAENVLRVYAKANAERIFKTPVGYDYLKRMRNYLLESGGFSEEMIPPVALYNTYTMKMRQSYSPARQHIRPSENKKAQWPLLSLIANIILVLAVAAMFSITLKSDNPNILNYKKQITNQYASWEQELTERERAVREKEKELNINNP